MGSIKGRLLCIGAAGVILTFQSLAADSAGNAFATKKAVGRIGTNEFYTPANQVVTPAGSQVHLPGMRPQAIALSPDGRLLVVSGKTAQLVVLNPETSEILERVALPPEPGKEEKNPVSTQILEPDTEGQLSFTGLVFSPDGSRIYLSNVGGTIKVFAVEKGKVRPLRSFSLPPSTAPERKTEIPAGLAVSKDGKKLYVALNLSNRAAELDAQTGKVLRQWEVGVAPFDVELCGSKLFVSNWGGRRPATDSVTGPAGRGMKVRVDAKRHIANEGSVSIIALDKTTNDAPVEILVGMRASDLCATPDAKYVLVANSGSDTLSVIDSRTDKVVETVFTRQNPSDLFGAQPNAIAFEPSGNRLYVCNGSQNAVAVLAFKPGQTRMLGLIPTGWFPGAIAYDANRERLSVANIKGLSPGKPRKAAGPEFNTHQYHGSVSLIEVPGKSALKTHTANALANIRYTLLRQAARAPRKGQPARPVPERVGEPSVFKHVVYIIKENRTYDQVLGDMQEGNGDTNLCIFGERVTPNQHKMARDYVLLDNTYCSGILSADGHQWADTAMAIDYMERSFAGFPRSYPDGMGDDEVDALAYSPAGFIWDSVLAAGKTLRNYGEFAITEAFWRDRSRKGSIGFKDFYSEFVNGTSNIVIRSRPGIESLRPYLATNTVGWDMRIPDVFRAAKFIEELKAFERKGTFPNFTIICLPNNHTSGTGAGAPTPAAQVADNDLAFAQIVEALSRSKFWPETCVFAIEDDPQNGWDHVSGYRTTAFVISPYTKRGEVISTQYNQTSILRTMGLILGLPPMNQMDATATPMYDCFTDQPNFTPFAALPNNVPLDEMNPDPKALKDPLLKKHAIASRRLPLDKVDQCPEDLLNRILWHAIKGSQAEYPAWAVRLEEED